VFKLTSFNYEYHKLVSCLEMEPQNFIFFNYLNFQKVRKKFLDSKSLAEVVEELFNLNLVIKLWNSTQFYNLIIPERI